jgi:L-threonylcarbamoyladenylate synthase
MVSQSILSEAVGRLQQGDLVAMPTETVYGLAGDALNPLAVRRIYALKGRPAGHPVIVHLGPKANPADWGRINPVAQTLIDAFWPGPITLIVEKHPRVPDEVTGGLTTVGLRMPSHPVAQQLLNSFGSGLAAPSANRFGRISPTTAEHVVAEFGDDLLVLDGGPASVGVESTIVDTTGERPAILRSGSVTRKHIESIAGPLGHSETTAPGTLKSHYAPMTSLLLSDAPADDRKRLESDGLNVAVLDATPHEEHARTLYAELRRLDALGVDILIAERAENHGLGEAINDRLNRAASKFSTDLD